MLGVDARVVAQRCPIHRLGSLPFVRIPPFNQPNQSSSYSPHGFALQWDRSGKRSQKRSERRHHSGSTRGGWQAARTKALFSARLDLSRSRWLCGNVACGCELGLPAVFPVRISMAMTSVGPPPDTLGTRFYWGHGFSSGEDTRIITVCRVGRASRSGAGGGVSISSGKNHTIFAITLPENARERAHVATRATKVLPLVDFSTSEGVVNLPQSVFLGTMLFRRWQ